MSNYANIIKVVLINLVVSMQGIYAADDSGSSSESPDFIRTIPNPGVLPLCSIKFECFRLSNMVTNDYLPMKHSQLIRQTILNVLALVDYAPDNHFHKIFEDKEFETNIRKSFGIASKWGHHSLTFFQSLVDLYSISSSKTKKFRNKVEEIVTTFTTAMDQTSDIDGLELQLLCMRIGKDFHFNRLLNITQRLIDQKREEIAFDYLLSFARQVRNLKVSGLICAEALKLDCRNAGELSNALRNAEQIINTRVIGDDMEVDAMEAALRCMPLQYLDSEFVFSLSDRLVKAGRRDAVIHYLLELGDAYRSNSSGENSRDLYLRTAAYYVKAEELGSVEATHKRFKLKHELGLEPTDLAEALFNPYIDPDVELTLKWLPVPLSSSEPKYPSISTSSTDLDDSASVG